MEHRINPSRIGPTIRRLLRRGAKSKISKAIAKVRPEDVAVMLQDFTPSEQIGVFRILIADFPQAASDVLVTVEPQTRLAVMAELSPGQVAKMLELAAVDDAVFLLEALPAELKEKVLEIVDLEERFSEVQERLTYEDETAGRIMDSEFVALSEETLVHEAIAQLRQIARDVDMISYLYVVDQAGRLQGVSPLRQLLLADPDERLGDLMNTSVVKVHIDTDQEEVAQMAARYDLLAIPVTDDDGRLVGIVTVDDIIDVFKDEATEDFYKMAGTSDDELVYQDHSFKVAGIRLPWILFNLLGLLLAGFFVTRFEEAFEIALMVGFIPVIMGMAGNIGSQTTTIAVRGLATGRLGGDTEGRTVRHFLWQQIKVGALLGLVCATLVAASAYAFNRLLFTPTESSSATALVVAAVIGVSLFATVQLASLNGVLIPVVFQRLGFDPAVASAPLVTTANDVLGILIYFGLAGLSFRLLGI